MTMPDTSPAMPPKRQAGFLFVMITIVLDMLAIGIMIPVLPNLVAQMTGGNISQAAFLGGVFAAIWAGMQFMMMPIAGALSDQWGRRPIFLISNFGTGLAYVMIALSPNLWFLALARIVSGATSASVSTAFAYVSDIEAPENRAKRFGQLGAGFSIGFILGPALGGYLGSFDLHLPFWVCAVISTLNGLYGLFILPESHKIENRTPFAWRKANPLASLGFLTQNRHLLPLASIKALNDMAHSVLPSTFVLYALERFQWHQDKSGLLMGLVGIIGAIVGGFLTGPIVKKLGETRALFTGLVFGILGFIGYGFVDKPWMIWFVIPVASFWALFTPAVQSLLTSQVAPTEQGRLQGALGSVQSGVSIFAPFMFASVFSYAIAPHHAHPIPGLAFYLAAAILALSFILALLVHLPTTAKAAAAESN